MPATNVIKAPKNVKKSAPVQVQKQGLTVVQSLKSNKFSISNRALAIVAEEVGLDVSELKPSSDFADFGVDSLLSLNIVGRFREELELEVESTLFADHPTVKDLLGFLPGGKDASESASTSTTSSTPEMESLSTATSTTDDTEYSLLDADEVVSDGTNTLAAIRLTIAEEVGIPVEELTGTLSFSEVGMDSLLSITVLGKLREVLDMEFPGTMFQDNDSLNEVEAALGLKTKPSIVTSTTQAPVVQNTTNTASLHPPTTSILLQGNPKTASKILFLFPDGSGSATSYAPLPKVSSDIVIYGLNCPYMKRPQDMKCSLEDLTPSYLGEVRRRQPRGPYYFGGWSAGGICAFDAAQQLDREGEKVAKLILLDSPFPIGLEKLPPRLYDFFNSIGLFGTGSKAPPEWLLPHFLAFVDSLDKYRAVPFPARGNTPQTHILWARDGVCKNASDPRPPMHEDDPKEMKWLLNNRTDFGTNGWDTLLGDNKVIVRTLHDANHFTMMEGKKVFEVAGFIKEAMK